MFLDIGGQYIYRCFWISGITFIGKEMVSENLRALAGDAFFFCMGRRSGKFNGQVNTCIFVFIKSGKRLVQFRDIHGFFIWLAGVVWFD